MGSSDLSMGRKRLKFIQVSVRDVVQLELHPFLTPAHVDRFDSKWFQPHHMQEVEELLKPVLGIVQMGGSGVLKDSDLKKLSNTSLLGSSVRVGFTLKQKAEKQTLLYRASSHGYRCHSIVALKVVAYVCPRLQMNVHTLSSAFGKLLHSTEGKDQTEISSYFQPVTTSAMTSAVMAASCSASSGSITASTTSVTTCGDHDTAASTSTATSHLQSLKRMREEREQKKRSPRSYSVREKTEEKRRADNSSDGRQEKPVTAYCGSRDKREEAGAAAIVTHLEPGHLQDWELPDLTGPEGGESSGRGPDCSAPVSSSNACTYVRGPSPKGSKLSLPPWRRAVRSELKNCTASEHGEGLHRGQPVVLSDDEARSACDVKNDSDQNSCNSKVKPNYDPNNCFNRPRSVRQPEKSCDSKSKPVCDPKKRESSAKPVCDTKTQAGHSKTSPKGRCGKLEDAKASPTRSFHLVDIDFGFPCPDQPVKKKRSPSTTKAVAKAATWRKEQGQVCQTDRVDDSKQRSEKTSMSQMSRGETVRNKGEDVSPDSCEQKSGSSRAKTNLSRNKKRRKEQRLSTHPSSSSVGPLVLFPSSNTASAASSSPTNCKTLTTPDVVFVTKASEPTVACSSSASSSVIPTPTTDSQSQPIPKKLLSVKASPESPGTPRSVLSHSGSASTPRTSRNRTTSPSSPKMADTHIGIPSIPRASSTHAGPNPCSAKTSSSHAGPNTCSPMTLGNPKISVSIKTSGIHAGPSPCKPKTRSRARLSSSKSSAKNADARPGTPKTPVPGEKNCEGTKLEKTDHRNLKPVQDKDPDDSQYDDWLPPLDVPYIHTMGKSERERSDPNLCSPKILGTHAGPNPCNPKTGSHAFLSSPKSSSKNADVAKPGTPKTPVPGEKDCEDTNLEKTDHRHLKPMQDKDPDWLPPLDVPYIQSTDHSMEKSRRKRSDCDVCVASTERRSGHSAGTSSNLRSPSCGHSHTKNPPSHDDSPRKAVKRGFPDISSSGPDVKRRRETLEDSSHQDRVTRSREARAVVSLSQEELRLLVLGFQDELQNIKQGTVYSHRHELYKKGGRERRDLDFTGNLQCFDNGQEDLVMDVLMTLFNPNDLKDVDYLVRVLLHEALNRIYKHVTGK